MIKRQPISRFAKQGLLILAMSVASNVVLSEDLQEVIVTATRPGLAAVAKNVVGRSSTTGAPVENLTLTWSVGHSDLDLSKHTDAVELERRIHARAKAVCDELDRLLPLSPPGGPACATAAADGAMIQAQRLIAAASGK